MNGAALLLVLELLTAFRSGPDVAGLSLLEALKSTVEHHPLVQVQEQDVQANRAALLRASSQFDLVLQSNIGQNRLYRPLSEAERAVSNVSSTISSVTTLDLGASRQFRNGITAGPVLEVTRTTDSLLSSIGLNQSHLVFQVNLPLLRGRGRGVVAAQETVAGIDVDASLFDLNQSISDLLANTAAAYWSAVAATRSVAVYREAEDRGQVYLETVRALIDADRLPRSEISQAQANVASRAAARLGAQQRLAEAQQQLAVAMGLRADQMMIARDPSDPLPAEDTPQTLGSGEGAVQLLIEGALMRRADLLALRKRQNAAAILHNSARNQLQPQLDLQLSTGYSGLGEGTGPQPYFTAPFSGIRGADVVAGMRFQLPVGQRAAVAGLMQADSVMRQTGYRLEEASRNVASSVIVAAQALRSAAEQLQQAREAVGFSQAALENEREKLRLGVGSLIDVLTVEERHTNVLIAEVQAELTFAVSLVGLRSATGTIVAPDKAGQDVDQRVFVTPPTLPLARP